MKKGQVCEGMIEYVDFPNKGIAICDGEKVVVKNGIPGQKVSFSINKVRKGKAEGRLLDVIEKSPIETVENVCEHFGLCGGCYYQSVPYEKQLEIKKEQIKKLLDSVISYPYEFEGIKGSPKQYGYRNKMEFSFGDEVKDGPLALGMHKKNSMYDIVTVKDCRIVDEDYRKILQYTVEYFTEVGIPFYHKMSHQGVLRHLLVRKAVKTGQILVDLITTSQLDFGLEQDKSGQRVIEVYRDGLLSLKLDGTITGILHTMNDSLADVVQNDSTEILYGTEFIQEELLGLEFKISPFSFFQTNSLGAEVLYDTVRGYIGETKDCNIFDLYSGTGTIAQILAPVAKKVIGVEIVEEAVEAARVNAKLNGLDNCEFIAGDVLKVIDELEAWPDLIVLDPPRDGIHPKALKKIASYQTKRMVYVSCKPTSLVRDLEELHEMGYVVEKACSVDMFPGTAHVETVVCLSREKADDCAEKPKMISEERSKYKSWSNLKKQMNDLLCDSLKGKISYFCTSYHEVHNAYGRATINHEKKELVAFSWVEMYKQGSETSSIYHERKQEGEKVSYLQLIGELEKEKWMPEGKLCDADFINSLTIYLKTDIATSLNSDNYLLRVFAYMDRRVGKRTLVKIKDEVEKLPEWVNQFYRLRCEADGIVFPPKRITDETVCLLKHI